MYFVLKNDKAKKACMDYIQGLEHGWAVQIKKHVKSRTVAQNSLMWMWLNIIAQETGNSEDDLHEIFKLKFLGSETVEAFGYKIERTKSTTKLTTAEFTSYLDKIDALMFSIGITLPKPDDLYHEAMGCK